MVAENYRTKPVVIEAMQWDGGLTNIHEIDDWMGRPAPRARIVSWRASERRGVYDVVVQTPAGRVAVSPGDWIIKGIVAGEFYPCKPAIFLATYEPVEDKSLPDVREAKAP